MADSGTSQFGFLTRKIGPAPVWVYGVVILAAYVWYTRFGPGKAATAGTAAATQAQAVDPVTGEPYSQELGAAEQQLSDQGSSGTGTTTAGGYSTNDQWATAAENYLVGLGIDPTVATQAIENYLTSQPNTTAQQADVNTAIEGIGPPPELPGPAAANPAPAAGNGAGATAGTGTGTGTTGSTPPATATAAAGPQVTVPSVEGLQVNDGISRLSAVGLGYHLNLVRNPADTYIINSQTPGAGAKAAKGSTVDLGIAQHTFPGESR